MINDGGVAVSESGRPVADQMPSQTSQLKPKASARKVATRVAQAAECGHADAAPDTRELMAILSCITR